MAGSVLVPPSDEPVQIEEVEEVMQSLGMSRAQFALSIGVSQSTLYRWLSGDWMPENPRMFRWAVQAMKGAFVAPGEERVPD